MSPNFSIRLKESDMSSKNGTKFYHRTDVKLTLWYILTFFLSVLVIFGFLYFRLKHQLIKEVDRILHDEANELSGLLVQDLKEMDVLRDFENSVTARTYYPIYFRILNRDGSLLYVSRNFDEIGYKHTDTMMSAVTQGKQTWRRSDLPEGKGPFVSSACLCPEKADRITSFRLPHTPVL